LVIDDDRQFCKLMKKMLELDGYEVTAISDMAVAWEHLGHELPDLVCCDMKLQGASGLDFLSRRAEIDGLVNVPIVTISGNYSQSSQDQAAELGAFAYLTKPFNPSELRTVIQSALASTTPA
jgi:CheY-like chemotaxis protein